MMQMSLKIAKIDNLKVNPCDITHVILQGCTHFCKACSKSEYKHSRLGKNIPVNDIISEIKEYNSKIILISGGEPLKQIFPLTTLCFHARHKSETKIALATNYSWSNILKLKTGIDKKEAFMIRLLVLKYVDILIENSCSEDRRFINVSNMVQHKKQSTKLDPIYKKLDNILKG